VQYSFDELLIRSLYSKVAHRILFKIWSMGQKKVEN